MTPSDFHGSRNTVRAAPPVSRRVLLGTIGAAAALSAVPRPAAAAAATSAAYPLLTRAQWGADERLRFAADGTEIWPPQYYPVQTISVHHTGDNIYNPDPAAWIRSLYRTDVQVDGYGDIGYNYLIDDNGRVYEGRWSGTDGTVAHDSAGRLVTGAHILGYNSGNIGIVLLGTLIDTPAAPAARSALVQLLADLAARHSIAPLGKVVYRNPVSGVSRPAPTIGGHRHWADTTCPGTLFTDMPAIREEVAALIAG